MKIWLPIKVHTTGGSSSFAHKFKAGMEKRGHVVLLSATPPAGHHYDAILVSPRAPLSTIYQARRDNKKIIHRLDGAYYPATPAGWRFPAYNAPLTIIQYLSDYTVYQSQYAARICRRLVGPRSDERSSIIYNGVDTAHFSPTGPRAQLRQSPNQHLFFTAQQFRRRDQIVPLVAALTAYQKLHQEKSKLVVAGDFTGEAASLLPSLQNNPSIQLLGPISNTRLPHYLRAADAFVYCHPNPACPNNVLEAMACALPIVGVNDGAMPEIVCHEQDGYLVNVPGNGHSTPRRLDPAAFADAMQWGYTHRAKSGAAARARAVDEFNLSHMIAAYEKIITAV